MKKNIGLVAITIIFKTRTGSSQILVQSPNFYMKEQYF